MNFTGVKTPLGVERTILNVCVLSLTIEHRGARRGVFINRSVDADMIIVYFYGSIDYIDMAAH